MVDIREERVEKTRAIGHQAKGRNGIKVNTYFNEELFQQILAEAKSRQWTFSHMVRFLCEASIEGIE